MKSKRKLLVLPSLLLAACLLIASNANAGIILGMADSNIGSSTNNQLFSNLFSGDDVFGRGGSGDWTLTNWSSRIGANGGNFSSASTLTAAALTGMEWVVASTNRAFSASELSALVDFVSGGGSVAVIGEGPIYSTINANANAILSALGSAMSFLGVQSSGTPTIASDPLTAGVTSFSGGYTGSISGGTALVSYGQNVAVAYETVDGEIPAPATLALMGLGLVGIGFARKTKAA
ncbi:MAG: PEP-CTERM sorting domain-containing protein [Sedimenticola sp.]